MMLHVTSFVCPVMLCTMPLSMQFCPTGGLDKVVLSGDQCPIHELSSLQPQTVRYIDVLRTVQSTIQ